MSSRWRAAAALTLALAAVLAAMPPAIAPWAVPLRRALADVGPFAVTLVVALTLVVAALLMPRAQHPLQRRPELLPAGLGWLLLLEPPLHLALLALIAWHAPPNSGDLMLPRVGARAALLSWQLAVLWLVVPIAEEFFFRGRLQPWVAERLGAPSAVTLGALAFACAHGDPSQALIALPLGLLLGGMRARGASLLACVLVHQAHNVLFLVGGPAVVSAPWVGLGLSLCGVACLGLAAMWPGRVGGGSPRRALAVCLLVSALVGAGWPIYRATQDRLWVSAMHRAIAYGSLPDDILVQRLHRLCDRGRLSARRRDELAARLAEKPATSRDRQVWVLARLRPESLRDRDERLASDDLARLASYPQDLEPLAAAARTLALDRPNAFAEFATIAPEAVARWYHLPGHEDDVLAQVLASEGGDRMRVLASFERAQPGLVADALLRMPIARITPIDRRFLFMRYADARERVLHAAHGHEEVVKAWGVE